MTMCRKVFDGLRLAALVADAWIALMIADLQCLAGFASLHESIASRAVRGRAGSTTVEEIVWAVEEACVWYIKRAACLQRSAVITRLLRRRGHAATLVIGYRPIPFESHAWVEVGGRVVNDLPQYQKAFTVLDRL